MECTEPPVHKEIPECRDRLRGARTSQCTRGHGVRGAPQSTDGAEGARSDSGVQRHPLIPIQSLGCTSSSGAQRPPHARSGRMVHGVCGDTNGSRAAVTGSGVLGL